MAKNKNFYTPQNGDEKIIGMEQMADGGTAVSTYNKHTGTTSIKVTRGFKETPWERNDRIQNSPRAVKIPNNKKRTRANEKKDAINKSMGND